MESDIAGMVIESFIDCQVGLPPASRGLVLPVQVLPDLPVHRHADLVVGAVARHHGIRPLARK